MRARLDIEVWAIHIWLEEAPQHFINNFSVYRDESASIFMEK
jgi:hypothetical protein